VAALNLAPSRRVIVVERRMGASPRIGEALPPAARRLLADMGLLDPFLRERHTPCYGNRTVWGARTPEVTDFMRDPDGHGWHLDRARFDSWLRFVAVARGARLLAPASPSLIRRADGRWHVQLTTHRGIVDLSAAFCHRRRRTRSAARSLARRQAPCDRPIGVRLGAWSGALERTRDWSDHG